MAQKIGWGKLIKTGLVWSPLYAAALAFAARFFFGFAVFSADAWAERWQAFLSGRWEIKTPPDVGLAALMALCVPLWLAGWRACCRIRWSFPSFRRAAALLPSKNKISLKASKKPFVPHRIRVQSGILLTTPQTPDAAGAAAAEASSEALANGVYEEDVQELIQAAQAYEADVYPHIMLGKQYVPLAIATDDVALVVKLVGNEVGQWSVDLNDDMPQGDWYSAQDIMKSPVPDLKEAVQSLQETEPEAHIAPVLVLARGMILNATETADYFRKNGIVLRRLEEAGPPELPLFRDILPEYFQLKTPAASAAPAAPAETGETHEKA